MKLLHVAVFSPNSTNVWQAKGFENQGVDVIRYDYRKKLKDMGGDVTKRDDDLINICENEEPDFVLFSKCNMMEPRVNKFCQEKSISVMWYMDDLYNMDKEFMSKMQFTDYLFTSCIGCLDVFNGVCDNVYRLQGGYDPDIHKPMSVQKTRDVVFIGDLRPKRKDFFNHVKFEVINGVYNLEHSKVVSETKINLNFTEGRGTSNRLYKIMAAGGFVLTQPWINMEEDFTIGEHLDIFETVGELRQKIKYYLENEKEREKIANNGYERVKLYDNNNYAKNIIDKVFGG